MSLLSKKLTKKIEKIQVFVVLGTKNYLKALENKDGEILTQIEIATILEKPFFIIIDATLSESEKEFIRKYFSKNNIIKEMVVDIKDTNAIENVANEIKRLSREMAGSDENIKIITPYSEDD